MLIPPQAPRRSNRQNASLAIQAGRARQVQGDGVAVVVLVSGSYNNAQHKSLGHCEEGALVRVAGGAYLQHLVQHGLVQLLDAVQPEEMSVKLDGGESDKPVEQPVAPEVLMEAGLTKKDATALIEAGFGTKAAVAQSFGVFGLNEFVGVKGVTEDKARKLVQWAGIELPKD